MGEGDTRALCSQGKGSIPASLSSWVPTSEGSQSERPLSRQVSNQVPHRTKMLVGRGVLPCTSTDNTLTDSLQVREKEPVTESATEPRSPEPQGTFATRPHMLSTRRRGLGKRCTQLLPSGDFYLSHRARRGAWASNAVAAQPHLPTTCLPGPGSWQHKCIHTYGAYPEGADFLQQRMVEDTMCSITLYQVSIHKSSKYTPEESCLLADRNWVLPPGASGARADQLVRGPAPLIPG